MKSVICLMAVSWLMTGCATFSGGIPHADSPAAVAGNSGPSLCHDGSVPPCTPRY